MSLLSIVASSSAFLLSASPPPKGSSIDSDWSIKNKKQPGFLRLISAWYAMFPSSFRIMISLFDHDLAPRVCQKNRTKFPAGTRYDKEVRARFGNAGSWRSVGAPSDVDIDGRSLQIEGAITWGPARGTARRRGQLRGA